MAKKGYTRKRKTRKVSNKRKPENSTRPKSKAKPKKKATYRPAKYLIRLRYKKR